MEENQSLLELEINEETSNSLSESSRWAKFFGVLVAIACGLLFLMFLVTWRQISALFFTMSEMQEGSASAVLIGLIVVFLVFGTILTVLLVFLIKGANNIRNGVRNRDQLLLNIGLANIRNYFAMFAILSIVGLLLSLLGLLN